MKATRKKRLRRKRNPTAALLGMNFWFPLRTVGFSGNCVIKFGCLFEFVTQTGWVTGAESRSKFRWFADDDFFFHNSIATGAIPVG